MFSLHSHLLGKFHLNTKINQLSFLNLARRSSANTPILELRYNNSLAIEITNSPLPPTSTLEYSDDAFTI